jgi:hypothetical protein
MFRELNDPIDPDKPEPTEPPVLCECGCVEPIQDSDGVSPVPGKVVNVTSVHWVLNG